MPAHVGLDLGNTSIKLAKISGKKVEALGLVGNPLGKVKLDSEAEAVRLAEVIKKLLDEHKINEKKFRIVIPEGLVYSQVIRLPVLSDAELASAIGWEAEQYIPEPLEEVEISWEVVDRPTKKVGEEKMSVYLAAANKKVINGLMAVFAKIGLEPDRIEPEMVTTARAVVLGRGLAGATMLCVMGANSVGLALFEDDKLLFVYRFNNGGVMMTRAIAATLQLPVNQAEEYKRSYGVRGDVLEGKLAAAMAPVTGGLVNEMKRAISFYAQTYAGKRIARVIVTGGVALTPGLVQWLSSQIGAEVVLGDPFTGMEVDPNQAKLGAVYAPVVGAVK